MVIRKENETVDSLIRRFKKEVMDSKIIQDYRVKQFYIGPSEKRRLKSEAARKRKMKQK